MATPSPPDELAPFVVNDVRGLDSGERKGSGAYGAVFKVTVKGVACIAKRLHDILVNREVSQRERESIQRRFRQECVILSKLKHPNIVHFVGVHYGRYQGDLSLVMEMLDTDLAKCLDEAFEKQQEIPLSIKLSLLLDVSDGLLYLHTLPQAIIHRDLSAGNILLTRHMQAKIADLGVSKLIDLRQVRAHTVAPGTSDYMPPEALQKNPVYDTKLDIFSFGHLMLYTTLQELPEVYENVTPEALNRGTIQILKRETSLDRMSKGHVLYPLIIQCLQDKPERRPTTLQLNQAVMKLSNECPIGLMDIIHKRSELESEVLSLKEQSEQQQLEYAESSSSAKKKIAKAEQLNVNLTGELEDYRTHTKRLLTDLQHKEDEITQLRQQVYESGSSEARTAELVHKQQAMAMDYKKQLLDMREQLESVTKERDTLLENRERVAAHWEGKTRRLERQLQEYQQGRQPTEVTDYERQLLDVREQLVSVTKEKQSLESLLEAYMYQGEQPAEDEDPNTARFLEDKVSELESEVETLKRQKERYSKQHSELKDQNAALQEQLSEYAKAINDQSKYIQGQYATSKAHDVELLQRQIHQAEFMKKQQLEFAESLGSTKKKIAGAEKILEENVRLNQLNVNLTGELEDYRTQTKRLLTDLQQKEDEITQLRQQVYESGSSEDPSPARFLEDKVSELESEVETLKRQKERYSKQHSELKDQNAALQEQLSEYAGAINDQSKYIQGQYATSKAHDVELLQRQIHQAEFMKKQQLEFAESLGSTKKKIAGAEKILEENVRLNQLNVNLTWELEDYRTQTKRLLTDLQQKEDEITQLRQQVYESGSSKSSRDRLELETMKQKCDAWQEEVEKLAPIREEVEHLRTHVGELENELGPLREERAGILRESAVLREGAQPEKYARLKQEYASLCAQCEQLQEALQHEKELIQRHLDTNVQLEQKLKEATNPDKLQFICERMERYRQERDQARLQMEEAQRQAEMEGQLRISEGPRAAEASEIRIAQLQRDLAELEIQESTLKAKAEENDEKMRRYRKERNQAIESNKAMEQQIQTLRDTIDQLVQEPVYESGTFDSMDYPSPHHSGHPSSYHVPSASPPRRTEGFGDFDRAYSPENYVDSYPQREISPSIKSDKRRSSQKPEQRKASSSSVSERGLSGEAILADVKTREGILQLYIQRPVEPLNPKNKPRVIVKRSNGEFDMGTLMYAGFLDGTDLAGVQLDISRGVSKSGNTNEGMFKDGKRYFRCERGYGLYATLANIYVEIGGITSTV